MQLVVLVSLLLLTFIANAQIDRTPMVTAAYRQIEQLLNFASEDRKFVASLEPEEKAQLRKVLKVVQHATRINFKPEGYNGHPIIDQFYQQVEAPEKAPDIVFSADTDSFILNPGEAPRSARTQSPFEAPIVFNLNVLNAADARPSYLDILQILVHEFGHKITTGKNQAALDSLAAKFKLYLQSYYIKTVVDKVTVEAVAIPIYIKYHGDEPMFRQRVIPVIVDNNGLYNHDYIGPHEFRQGSTKFVKISGNMDEIVSVRLARIFYDNGFNFEFQIKTDVMYRHPSVGLKDAGDGSFIPIPSYTPLMSRSRFQSRVFYSVQLGLRQHWQEPHANIIPFFNQRTTTLADRTIDYSLISQKQFNNRIQFTFAKPSAPEKVTAILENAQGEILVETVQVFSNDKVASFVLDFADRSDFLIKRLMLNDEDSFSLSKPVKMGQAKPSDPEKRERFKQVEIFDMERQKWVEFKPADLRVWTSSEIKFRVQVEKSFTPAQFQLHWGVGQKLFLTMEDNPFGIFGTPFTEIVKTFSVVASDESTKTIEFVARPFAGIVRAQTNPTQKISAIDSGHRFLNALEAVQSDHMTTRITYRNRMDTMPFNGEGFKITNIKEILSAVPVQCLQLFN